MGWESLGGGAHAPSCCGLGHEAAPPSRVQKWAVRMWGLGKVRRHASLGSQEGVGVGEGGGGVVVGVGNI